MTNEMLRLARQARWATLLTTVVMGVISYAVLRVEGPAAATIPFVIALFALALAIYFQCAIHRWRSKLLVAVALAGSLFVGGLIGTHTQQGGSAEAHTISCGAMPAKYTYIYPYGWVVSMSWLAWYSCWLSSISHTNWHIQMALAAELRP